MHLTFFMLVSRLRLPYYMSKVSPIQTKGDMLLKKLVCFDLDGTLIQGIHSVMLLCLLNGKMQEHSLIQKQEENGIINYKTADYLRAKLTAGLPVSRVNQHFQRIITPLHNISRTVQALRAQNMHAVLITVGPQQVAQAARQLWGFDAAYGSVYETHGGYFTGNITSYVDAEQKVECLYRHCANFSILHNECIAIGDGATDLPLFNYCGSSIAINASPTAIAAASASICTTNLLDILPFLYN